TDAWRNSLDHYQEFVIIVALDLKIEEWAYWSITTKYLRETIIRNHAAFHLALKLLFVVHFNLPPMIYSSVFNLTCRELFGAYKK
ncbi:hypothetical protein, partial [Lacticaseibacillus rhamnosus]|uniref:hypothetical protein n=1 Tax=Lacticaseibacillus rhamnosus TaxID=47715 RepID=UPI001E3488E7